MPTKVEPNKCLEVYRQRILYLRSNADASAIVKVDSMEMYVDVGCQDAQSMLLAIHGDPWQSMPSPSHGQVAWHAMAWCMQACMATGPA